MLSISVKFKVFICFILLFAISGQTVMAHGKEIKNVPVIAQKPELPTGCEAVSATMLLRWAGVNVSKTDVAKALPKGSVPVSKNGKYIGDNPADVFVGDPFSSHSFGIFHKPIASIIDKYLPGRAQDITGTSFENLLSIIDSGRPAVVWATIGMRPGRVTATWQDESGNMVKWIAPEHALVLIGYTDTSVIVNDPWTGKKRSFSLSLFKSRWEYMGKQAVTISQNEAVTAPMPSRSGLSGEKGQIIEENKDGTDNDSRIIENSKDTGVKSIIISEKNNDPENLTVEALLHKSVLYEGTVFNDKSDFDVAYEVWGTDSKDRAIPA